MLELSKNILKKVSFDKSLFKKELTKSLKWIQPSEKTALKLWCLATFGTLYKSEILDVFQNL
jgi:hypothetical protein